MKGKGGGSWREVCEEIDIWLGSANTAIFNRIIIYKDKYNDRMSMRYYLICMYVYTYVVSVDQSKLIHSIPYKII